MTIGLARLVDAPLEQLRGAGVVSLVMAALGATASFVGVGSPVPGSSLTSSVVRQLPVIEAPPLLWRNIDPRDAVALNRKIPFAPGPNPPARPFEANGDQTTYARALECLTAAIYYEAGSEPAEGQRAVAQVVLNRVRHPAFSRSVCGVVYHGSTRTTGCQFSFTCDGSLQRRPTSSGWQEARDIAAKALVGGIFKPVGYATHYHADYVVPYWATSLAKNAVVGRHIFYRWPEYWGTPGAFSRRHAASEPDPRLLRDLALRRPHIPVAPLIARQAVIESDPRVELTGIIQMLAAAAPPSDEPGDYEKEVQTHFTPFAEHLAVQIYRQLAAGDAEFGSQDLLQIVLEASQPASAAKLDPALAKAVGGHAKLQGFITALRDFVEHSEFEKFYEERQAFYEKLAEQARKPALALLVYLAESATPLPASKVIVAPLLPALALGACYPAAEEEPAGWLVLGLRDGLHKSFANDASVREAVAELSKGKCGTPPASKTLAAR